MALLNKTTEYLQNVLIGLVYLYNLPVLMILLLVNSAGIKAIRNGKLSPFETVAFVFVASIVSTGIYALIYSLGLGSGMPVEA